MTGSWQQKDAAWSRGAQRHSSLQSGAWDTTRSCEKRNRQIIVNTNAMILSFMYIITKESELKMLGLT